MEEFFSNLPKCIFYVFGLETEKNRFQLKNWKNKTQRVPDEICENAFSSISGLICTIEGWND